MCLIHLQVNPLKGKDLRHRSVIEQTNSIRIFSHSISGTKFLPADTFHHLVNFNWLSSKASTFLETSTLGDSLSPPDYQHRLSTDPRLTSPNILRHGISNLRCLGLLHNLCLLLARDRSPGSTPCRSQGPQ